ncbi:MAG: hypothetical protein AAB214_12985 [Fibrobacterota bacterium]
MDDFVPQIVQAMEVVASCGTASMRAAWPGVLRDALRRAGTQGLCLSQLWDELARRDVIESNVAHQRAMNNALEYLEAVGLAKRIAAKWFAVPVLPPLPLRSQS